MSGASGGAVPFNCTEGSLSGSCTLRNVEIRWHGSDDLVVSVAQDLTLINSSIAVHSSSGGGGSGKWLNVTAGGLITMQASARLRANRVFVDCVDFSQDGSSVISAQSPLATSGPGISQNSGGGGGHGGSGSQAWISPQSFGEAFGSPFTSVSFGGCGTSRASGVDGGLGGGIICLRASNAVHADGNLDAAGSTPNTKELAGGGAGGTIIVEAASVGGSAVLNAQGAAGVNGGGSGGGGIVRINSANVTTDQFSVLTDGGIASSAGRGVAGGVGLSYYVQQRALNCTGNTISGSTMSTNWVWLDTATQGGTRNVSVDSLAITGGCFVAWYSESTNNLTWDITNDLIIGDQASLTVHTPLLIKAKTVKILSSQYQNENQFSYFDVGYMLVDQMSSVTTQSCWLKATSLVIDTSFDVTGGPLLLSVTDLQVGGAVSASTIAVTADTARFTGVMQASYRITTGNCSSLAAYDTMALSIRASQLVVIDSGGSIQAGTVQIETNRAFVVGTIVADALGCYAGHGEGAGSTQPSSPVLASNFPTGGGGHAGKGGLGSNGPEKIPGGSKYGKLTADPLTFTIGSGGGHSNVASKSSPGAGGGLVWINASDTIDITGSITAKGADGARDGISDIIIGGGSGGSVVLMAARLLGPSGRIFTNGGEGGEGGGGGGAGGYVIFAPHSNSSDYGDFDTTHAVSKGGSGGLPGSDGAHGIVSKYPNCGNGMDGIICTPCRVGFYKNENMSVCAACPDGTYTNATMATRCYECPAGTFASEGNQGSAGCTPCPGGTYAAGPGNAVCDLCAVGSYSDPGSIACSPCQENTYTNHNGSAQCDICPRGMFSEINSTSCKNCSGKPSIAQYDLGEGCSYSCPDGLVKPNCLQPFTELVRACGGAYVFAAIVMGATVVGSLPFFLCFWRRRSKKMILLEQQLRDAPQDKRERPDSRRGSAVYGDQIDSKKYERLEDVDDAYLYEGEEVPLINESLRPSELGLLMNRIYLRGNNTPDHPLVLLGRDAPIHLGLVPSAWEAFRDAFNARLQWAEWERRVYTTLYFIYYPASLVFLYRMQQLKIRAARAYISGYDHAFFKNQHFKTLSSSLRFGMSKCDTYAWIDILAPNLSMKRMVLRTAEFPLVLVCSGSGSFHDPYYLDVQDAYIQSMVRYYGRSWASCLSHLNAHLRRVRTGHLPLLASALEYLSLVQHHGVIGLGACMPIEGVSIAIGVRADVAVNEWRPVVILDSLKERGDDVKLFEPVTLRPPEPAEFRDTSMATSAADSRRGSYHDEDSSVHGDASVHSGDNAEVRSDEAGGGTWLEGSDGDRSSDEDRFSDEVDDGLSGRRSRHRRGSQHSSSTKNTLLERALGDQWAPSSNRATRQERSARRMSGSGREVSGGRKKAVRYPVVVSEGIKVYRNVDEILSDKQPGIFGCLSACLMPLVTHPPILLSARLVAVVTFVILLALFFCLLFVQFAFIALHQSWYLIPLLVLPALPYVAVLSSLFGMATSSPRIIRASISFLLVSLINSCVAILCSTNSAVGLTTELLAGGQFVLTLAAIAALRLHVVHVDFARDMRYMSVAIKSPAQFGADNGATTLLKTSTSLRWDRKQFIQ